MPSGHRLQRKLLRHHRSGHDRQRPLQLLPGHAGKEDVRTGSRCWPTTPGRSPTTTCRRQPGSTTPRTSTRATPMCILSIRQGGVTSIPAAANVPDIKALDRGLSDIDHPSAFSVSYVYATAEAHQGPRVVQALANGWRTSGLIQHHSGDPSPLTWHRITLHRPEPGPRAARLHPVGLLQDKTMRAIARLANPASTG